jgi:hypothetical protein
MSFEPEDKRAWEESIVMKELEKVAPSIYKEADESFEPIKLSEKAEEPIESWEDEGDGEDDQILANDIFERMELFGSINKELFDKIRTISHSLADRGLKKEAFKIERILKDLNRRSE